MVVGLFKNRMIFSPSREVDRTPADFGLVFEDVAFDTADGVKLHGWWLPNEGARHTLLWFHGNGGNIGYRAGSLVSMMAFPVNVFIFDYRGYGRSEGKPTEAGLYLDADAAVGVLEARFAVARRQIVLYGRSLGGAVAVDLAARERGFAGLVVVATFSSLRDMASMVVPIPGIGWCVRHDFDSRSKIADIELPLLVVHGSEDRVVPIGLGRKLFDVASEPKCFVEVAGAGHEEMRAVADGFGGALAEFLASLPR